jgi:hypothetical protein
MLNKLLHNSSLRPVVSDVGEVQKFASPLYGSPETLYHNFYYPHSLSKLLFHCHLAPLSFFRFHSSRKILPPQEKLPQSQNNKNIVTQNPRYLNNNFHSLSHQVREGKFYDIFFMIFYTLSNIIKPIKNISEDTTDEQ